jgi:hypothetical protein
MSLAAKACPPEARGSDHEPAPAAGRFYITARTALQWRLRPRGNWALVVELARQACMEIPQKVSRNG